MTSAAGAGHNGLVPPWHPTGLEAQTPNSDDSEGTGRPLVMEEVAHLDGDTEDQQDTGEKERSR